MIYRIESIHLFNFHKTMSIKYLLIMYLISSVLADDIIVKLIQDFIDDEIAGHVDVCKFVVCSESGMVQSDFK